MPRNVEKREKKKKKNIKSLPNASKRRETRKDKKNIPLKISKNRQKYMGPKDVSKGPPSNGIVEFSAIFQSLRLKLGKIFKKKKSKIVKNASKLVKNAKKQKNKFSFKII
jgi:hypothetical protein